MRAIFEFGSQISHLDFKPISSVNNGDSRVVGLENLPKIG